MEHPHRFQLIEMASKALALLPRTERKSHLQNLEWFFLVKKRCPPNSGLRIVEPVVWFSDGLQVNQIASRKMTLKEESQENEQSCSLCPSMNNHLLLALMEVFIASKAFLIDVIFFGHEESIFFSSGSRILHFLWGNSPSSTKRTFVLYSKGGSGEPDLTNQGLRLLWSRWLVQERHLVHVGLFREYRRLCEGPAWEFASCHSLTWFDVSLEPWGTMYEPENWNQCSKSQNWKGERNQAPVTSLSPWHSHACSLPWIPELRSKLSFWLKPVWTGVSVA